MDLLAAGHGGLPAVVGHQVGGDDLQAGVVSSAAATRAVSRRDGAAGRSRTTSARRCSSLDDVYRNARVAAAQRDTSVSALVVAYLEQLSGRMDEFARLEALQREVQAGISQFRAADRLSRDEAHDRAVR
ncbi:MAG: hypothetical protein ACRDNT_07000 [Streptosporangiaceae bacterium]